MAKESSYKEIRGRLQALQIESQANPTHEIIIRFRNLIKDFLDLYEAEIDDDIANTIVKAEKDIELAQEDVNHPYNYVLIRNAAKGIDKILFQKLEEEGYQ